MHRSGAGSRLILKQQAVALLRSVERDCREAAHRFDVVREARLEQARGLTGGIAGRELLPSLGVPPQHPCVRQA